MADPTSTYRFGHWMSRFSRVGMTITLLILISRLYQYQPTSLQPVPRHHDAQRPAREVLDDFETQCSWWNAPMPCANVETRLARFTANQVRHATNILALVQDS
ncbi:hypothetical protein JAAARDRAFT_39791, partial [Jaapia argillacea MUCL 33604]